MDKDEALKLALEALQWNWGGEPLPTLELKAINAIKEALAQPDDLTIAYMSGVYDGKNKYAPRREWVGLTEEEYKNIARTMRIRYGSDESGPYVSYGSYDEGDEWEEIEIYVDDFAKAIEAKLKEKNGG